MNLPIELINHILTLRPTHPNALLINTEIKYFIKSFSYIDEEIDISDLIFHVYFLQKNNY